MKKAKVTHSNVQMHCITTGLNGITRMCQRCETRKRVGRRDRVNVAIAAKIHTMPSVYDLPLSDCIKDLSPPKRLLASGLRFAGSFVFVGNPILVSLFALAICLAISRLSLAGVRDMGAVETRHSAGPSSESLASIPSKELMRLRWPCSGSGVRERMIGR